MNRRARTARRILRDHKRVPGLYWHTSRGWHHRPWVCARCGYVREYPGE